MARPSKKQILSSILVLRVITLLALVATILLMGTNNFSIRDGTKTYFTDLRAYRYVVAVAGIVFIYTLIQLPFAIYHSATEKRWTDKAGFLPSFDFYGDKLASYLLATGVGVGFGVSCELKRLSNPYFAAFVAVGDTDILEEKSKTAKFFDRGNIATGILLVGFVTMAITSVLTSIKKKDTKAAGTKGGFFK